jgi:hypothetical protein
VTGMFARWQIDEPAFSGAEYQRLSDQGTWAAGVKSVDILGAANPGQHADYAAGSGPKWLTPPLLRI